MAVYMERVSNGASHSPAVITQGGRTVGLAGICWRISSSTSLPPSSLVRARVRLADALANGRLDQLIHLSWPDGRRANLRRLVCDLIEEYGRHTGHADLLREAVDGLVGEDPPPGWRPRPIAG